MSEEEGGKTAGKGYIPALDGLRTVAVAAVVLYHLDASILPCGLLGVTIFFVLSGYLITGILIKEWNRTHTIDLPHFWMNRVRRLVPAIVFLLLVVTVLTALLAPDMLTRLREDIVAALFFFSNWWLFDKAGEMSLLITKGFLFLVYISLFPQISLNWFLSF